MGQKPSDRQEEKNNHISNSFLDQVSPVMGNLFLPAAILFAFVIFNGASQASASMSGGCTDTVTGPIGQGSCEYKCRTQEPRCGRRFGEAYIGCGGFNVECLMTDLKEDPIMEICEFNCK